MDRSCDKDSQDRLIWKCFPDPGFCDLVVFSGRENVIEEHDDFPERTSKLGAVQLGNCEQLLVPKSPSTTAMIRLRALCDPKKLTDVCGTECKESSKQRFRKAIAIIRIANHLGAGDRDKRVLDVDVLRTELMPQASCYLAYRRVLVILKFAGIGTGRNFAGSALVVRD